MARRPVLGKEKVLPDLGRDGARHVIWGERRDQEEIYWLRPPKQWFKPLQRNNESNRFLFGQSRLLVVVDFLTVDHYAK